MPVNSVTALISFSVLKKIQTYLRSNMARERLNGLHVHPKIEFDFDNAINTFA
jgi:hypothetical protein